LLPPPFVNTLANIVSAKEHMTPHGPTAIGSGAWPFLEAQKLIERVKTLAPAKDFVLFETGYGPSGLPHIGTFGEIVRTSMVRRALAEISDLKSELIAFSDDMDGLRKVPDNVPNPDSLKPYLGGRIGSDGLEHGGTPLTSIPDPFGCCSSFGHHNNARLRAFLDEFGFAYSFLSATECYRSGRFDAALRSVLEHYDEITDIVLPTLGGMRPERARHYSPFLPLSPRSGKVLHAPAVEVKPGEGSIVFRDEFGQPFETKVTGGRCKLQWRVDWAMRWYALGVDYEMSGKDLIDSVRLAGAIARVLGAKPPEGFTYELFLDEKGEKISKSKGNGLSLEQWLAYGPKESLSLFMFQRPRQARRLYFDAIPRATDEYLDWLEKYPAQSALERYANPVWHVHAGQPPEPTSPLRFGMLLNLASVCNAEDASLLWGFIGRYAPGARPENQPMLAELAHKAVAFYRDFVRPAKRYRLPDARERAALEDLARTLAALAPDAEDETIQSEIYEIGKRRGFANLRDWFKALYEVLLGQSEGPRMGTFIALYGIKETRRLIARALAGEDLSGAKAQAGGPAPAIGSPR
jgi:lysyl-tRNA synthetase class 1